MSAPHTRQPSGSFEVNTIGSYVGDLHRELVACFNEYHEAVGCSDRQKMTQLASTIPDLLDKFEKENAPSSANPQWMVAKMRAGWCLAKGEYEEALEWEMAGFEHATSEPDHAETIEGKTKRRSVSASNIADELRRLGRAPEALKWAFLSIELWPTNSINHLVLAMAMYRTGSTIEAEQIMEELVRVADFRNSRDTLATCMAYERELHEMSDLKAVGALLAHVRCGVNNE